MSTQETSVNNTHTESAMDPLKPPQPMSLCCRSRSDRKMTHHSDYDQGDSGDHEADSNENCGFIGYLKSSYCYQLFRCVIEEVFPWLSSIEIFRDSIQTAGRSLKESPCCTVLYILMALFGFLPLLCFFLFVCGTFLLSMVWFIFCQVIAVTFAGVVFGGFFFFLVLICCVLAILFGLVIQIFISWDGACQLVTQVAEFVVSNARKLIEKAGFNLNRNVQ